MLTFIKETRKLYTPSGSSRKMALYKCSCGETKEICIRNVRKKITVSCGCLAIERITLLGRTKGKKRYWNYKHGMFGTRFYSIYRGMKSRCDGRLNCNSRYYSDKGIRCLWKDFESFRDDMYKSYLKHVKKFGEKETTLDRIDSSKNYHKSNCCWATWKEQAKEKRRKRET